MIKITKDNIIKGIGSLLPSTYDPKKVVDTAVLRLSQCQPALDFISSQGWKVMRAEYEGVIRELSDRILFLSTEGVKNAAGIQRTAAVIQAAEMFVGLSDRVIRAHSDALKTIDTHKERATGRG
jgi:hypothetical protein